jgi:hypothetical protein
MPWYRRKNREQDLDRELRIHLESEAAEQQEAGLTQRPPTTLPSARSATLLKEEVRLTPRAPE